MKVFFSMLFVFSCSLFIGQHLTPETLWKMNRLSGGSISPDGKFVLFSVKKYNLAENRGNAEIFVLELANKKIEQLTQTPFSEAEVQWGKNNMIWFISPESGSAQIWRMKHDGTDKKQVSNFKNVELEGFKLSGDEKYICTIEAIKMLPTVQDKYSDLPKANARIENDLMYRHWDHFDDYMRRHLFLHRIVSTNRENVQVEEKGVDVLSGETYDGILPPFGGSEQFCFSPDGTKLIYTSKKMKGKEFATSTNSALYEYTIGTSTTKNLTVPYKGYDNNPSYSSTNQLAWLSMAKDGFEADKNDIIVRDFNGRDKNLTKDIDLSVSDYVWHPSGKSIYFLAVINGTTQVFTIDVVTAKHEQLTKGKNDYVSISAYADFIVAGKQSMIAPTDLYQINTTRQRETQITQVNNELLSKLTMPRVEARWMETTDGKKMLTWVLYPPNFDPNKKYPALLYCQGGPQSAVSQFFSYRWNLALMASQGYIVVAPNRRGLPGFGQEWNDAISKDWGGQAMKDYLTAIDNISQEPFVDEKRLGAVGASYGGYSVYMLAGIHENRFKTFVAHCGLFNLESWYGTTEELFFANWDHGGPYWLPENKENYKKNSPHNYVQHWNTPIMVIHGGMDYRVPESEGMQAFQAAQLLGLKSRYLYFPTESHWVQSPQNSVLWQREFFEWLAEDLKP